MGNGLSSNNHLIAAAVEASYGQDAIAALLNAGSNEITYIEHDVGASLNRTVTKRQSNSATPCPAGRKFRNIPQGSAVEVSGELRGWESGGVGEELPHYDPFLVAAGFTPVVNPGVDVVYSLGCNTGGSMSAYKWMAKLADNNYRLQYQTGIIGNFSISGNAGEQLKWSFSGDGASANAMSEEAAFFDASGVPILVPDGTFNAKCQPNTAVPGGTPTAQCDEALPTDMISIDVGITKDVDPTVEYSVSSFEFSTNWDINPTNVATADGKTTTCCLNRTRTNNATLSLTIEDCDDGVSFADALDKWLTGDVVAVKIVVYAGDKTVSGTPRITIDIPKTQLDIGQLQDNNGRAAWTIPAEVVNDCILPNEAFNEVQITYDAVP